MLYVCFSLSYFLRKMLISRELIKGDWDGVLSVDVKNELLHNALNSRLQYAYYITKPWNCWWFRVCSVVHFLFSKSFGSCNFGRLLLEVDDISCLISVPLQILVDGGKCIELCRVLKTSTYMLYSHTILHFRCSISVPIWYHMFFFPTKRNHWPSFWLNFSRRNIKTKHGMFLSKPIFHIILFTNNIWQQTCNIIILTNNKWQEACHMQYLWISCTFECLSTW